MSADAQAPVESRLMDLAGQIAPLRTLFQADPDRAQRYARRGPGLYLDFSKQRIDDAVFADLLALAGSRGVSEALQRLFGGERVNVTENRAALHMALRAPRDAVMTLDGENVVPEVHAVLDRMIAFAEAVRSGQWTGCQGQAITDVVNIGIGGSDLGPRMVATALASQADGPRLHFVANVDPAQLDQVLRGLLPERTLVMVTSKTFTTQETLANAQAARAWLLTSVPESSLYHHLAAVTTNLEAAAAFGIPAPQCFGFWDWVGGRYSVWSAVGLAVMVGLGPARFRALLDGAAAMDQHVRSTPLAENLPVLMALLAWWNQHALGAASQVVAPYAQDLQQFVPWLQQLEMESNGKGVHRDGRPLRWATTPALWGDVGTNSQHAFFQMLHQGPALHPVDFILLVAPTVPGTEARHRLLLANGLAQSSALMTGRGPEAVREELQSQGVSGEALEAALPHRVFPGNRPSNTLLMDRLDAWHLGSLMALYEHRTYVLSVLWDVHPFDQWGVELGKRLARSTLRALEGNPEPSLDASSAALATQIRSQWPPGSASP